MASGRHRHQPPAWLGAAVPAAVRLAAEAGAEVDDVLADPRSGPGAARRLSKHLARIEDSAHPTEVATDLAALLWAECEDVPRIATILDEPAAQAALEAVAEARRCAAGRVAEAVASCRGATAAASATDRVGSPSLPPAPPPADLVAPAATPSVPAHLPGGEGAAAPEPPVAPGAPRPLSTSAVAARRSVSGAALAGVAATAILLFGRHLRRA